MKDRVRAEGQITEGWWVTDPFPPYYYEHCNNQVILVEHYALADGMTVNISSCYTPINVSIH